MRRRRVTDSPHRRDFFEERRGPPRLRGRPLPYVPWSNTSLADPIPLPMVLAVIALLPSGQADALSCCQNCSFVGCIPMAHMFAYLRFNSIVTGAAARLATNPSGSTLVGQDLHLLDDDSEFQGSIVYLLSFPTNIAWPRPAFSFYSE